MYNDLVIGVSVLRPCDEEFDPPGGVWLYRSAEDWFLESRVCAANEEGAFPRARIGKAVGDGIVRKLAALRLPLTSPGELIMPKHDLEMRIRSGDSLVLFRWTEHFPNPGWEGLAEIATEILRLAKERGLPEPVHARGLE